MDAGKPVLEGPIGRTLVRLAGPVLVGEAFHTAFHLVDVAWVGFLGAWATGALVTAMFSLWIPYSLANLSMVGLGAHVSRAIGAGDRDRAGHSVTQGLWLTAAVSLLVTAAGWFGAEPLFRLVGADPQVAAAGVTYLKIIALGTPAAFAYLTLGAVMRACGNTFTPMLVTGSAVVANIVLAPIFVFGWGPIPRLEVAGSAIATVLAQAGAAVTYAVMLARGHKDLPWTAEGPQSRTIGALARVGAPYAAIGSLFSLVYLWYAHLAAQFGAAALAVLGIGNRLESLTYLTGDSFAMATATFVGQNMGAKNTKRAEQGAWRSAQIMMLVGAAISLIMILVPEQLLYLFTRDPVALRDGVAYVRIIALCQLATGLEGAIGGGFAGAGNTMPPMLVHSTFALARIPLAWWAVFVLDQGLLGIAWSMSLTCLVRAVLLAAWFKRGSWKTQELPDPRHPLPSAEEPEPTGL